jgi:hypothetical protein
MVHLLCMINSEDIVKFPGDREAQKTLLTVVGGLLRTRFRRDGQSGNPVFRAHSTHAAPSRCTRRSAFVKIGSIKSLNPASNGEPIRSATSPDYVPHAHLSIMGMRSIYVDKSIGAVFRRDGEAPTAADGDEADDEA